MTQPFETVLPSNLADAIDETFSPMDGIVALDEIYLELPKLHRPKTRLGIARKIYHGRFDWYPLGFTYEQIGSELHVRDVWYADEKRLFGRRRCDVILGEESSEFWAMYEPKQHGPFETISEEA
jgi:hypothetical protein